MIKHAPLEACYPGSRQEFERLARSEMFDTTHDDRAPMVVYVSKDTDIAYEGWKDYFAGVEYNYIAYKREFEQAFWNFGWKMASKSIYAIVRDDIINLKGQ